MFWTKMIRAPLEGELLISKEKARRFKRLLSLTFLLLRLSLYMIFMSFNTIWWCVRRPLETVGDASASQVLLAPFLVCWQETHDWLHTNEIKVSNFPSTSLVPVEYFHPIKLAPMCNSLFHIQLDIEGWGENVYKRFSERLCRATWWRVSQQDSRAVLYHAGILICVSTGGLLPALK